MDTIDKKPYEKFPVKFNFSNDLDALEVITAHTILCVNAVTGADTLATIIASDSLSSPDVIAVLQNGSLGDKHKITVRVNTSMGNDYEKDVILEVGERMEGVFTKQPNDTFLIAADFSNVMDGTDTLSSQSVTAKRKSDGVFVTNEIIYASGIEGGKPQVLIGVTDGIDKEIYRIVTQVVTTAGYKMESEILMTVQEF